MDRIPRDLREPSAPVSFPIDGLDYLASRSYFDSFHYPFNVASVSLPANAIPQPPRRRLLACHDMQGGYRDDRWLQGGSNPAAYSFWHWYLIDTFVYFSHHMVTLPPPCWTNAAHRHGVKVLGTFILEWDEGRLKANKLLSTQESARMYAERLAELATALRFDGWLLNMEIGLRPDQIPVLEEFVSHLTQRMHASAPGSLVIWYDGVTKCGCLSSQNQLNGNNKPFFDLCDGIFINYFWKENDPSISANAAGGRKFDVYMGIDVFGRKTFGGGQWNVNAALEVLKKNDISAAIFAFGWVYEEPGPSNFESNQNRWWDLVEKSWEVLRPYPKLIPFYANFDKGQGYHFSIEGLQVNEKPWNNISCQQIQDKLTGKTIGRGRKEWGVYRLSHTVVVAFATQGLVFAGFPLQWHHRLSHLPINHLRRVLPHIPSTTVSPMMHASWASTTRSKGESYNGGGNLTFIGNLDGEAIFTTRIFSAELSLEGPVKISFSVRPNGNSSLGLGLVFSSKTDGRTSTLVADNGNVLLTDKFDEVVSASRSASNAEGQGWVVFETDIQKSGCMLSEIYVVCCTKRLQKNEQDVLQLQGRKFLNKDTGSANLFNASLGHLAIRYSNQNPDFPPANAWIIEFHNIKWSLNSDGSVALDTKIIWKLKAEHDSPFGSYNIYVEKSPNSKWDDEISSDGIVREFIGVATLQIYFVSNLKVHSGTRLLRFIIQACAPDGTCQKVDESPTHELDVAA